MFSSLCEVYCCKRRKSFLKMVKTRKENFPFYEQNPFKIIFDVCIFSFSLLVPKTPPKPLPFYSYLSFCCLSKFPSVVTTLAVHVTIFYAIIT